MAGLQGHAELKSEILRVSSLWMAYDRRQASVFQSELNSKTVQQQGAQDRLSELKTRHQEVKKQLAELQRSHNELQENHNRQAIDLNRERRLKELEEFKVADLRGQVTRLQNQAARATATDAQAIRQLARMECRPLSGCTPEEKAAMKKRLQLKWHPDKQPSAAHTTTATQIFQEMQNQPQWTD